MNQLTTVTQTVNSTEIARMVDKRHSDLMRDIRGYISNMEMSATLHPSDFFIESNYTDNANRVKPCYQVTKKGCAFISNKLTGAKGDNFTAMYVNKFEEMEQQIQNNTPALTREQQLYLRAGAGGVDAVLALKEYGEIVSEEARSEARLEELSKNDNKITATKLVWGLRNIAGLEKLTTTIWNKFLEANKYGKYVLVGREKKATFIPNDNFTEQLVKQGYATTTLTNDGKKKKVEYRLGAVERMSKREGLISSLIKFVEEYLEEKQQEVLF